MKPRLKCARITGRGKYEEGKKQLMVWSISCVKRGGGSVMAWACRAAHETGSLVFTDDRKKHLNEF